MALLTIMCVLGFLFSLFYEETFNEKLSDLVTFWKSWSHELISLSNFLMKNTSPGIKKSNFKEIFCVYMWILLDLG